MSTFFPFKIAQHDYATVSDYMLKSINDFDGIAGHYLQEDIFSLLAMIYRAEQGNEENVIQRLSAFSDMTIDQQRAEQKALRREYACGRSLVEELHAAHIAVRGAPLEYRPTSTTDADNILRNAPWLSGFHDSIAATHGISTFKNIEAGMAAHVLRAISQAPNDTEISPPKQVASFNLLNDAERAIIEAGLVAARGGVAHLQTLPLFLMHKIEGTPVIVSDDTCTMMEEKRKRPDRIMELWAMKEDGLGYEIESHEPDYSAWVVPAGDGHGNIILATRGEESRPIANEDDLSEMKDNALVGLRGVRERYVDPEFRGKGLGISLITTREKNPLLSRFVAGSGFFSPGGYASRIKAHQNLTQAHLSQTCAMEKPDMAPKPGDTPAPASQSTAKGPKPNPF